MRIAIFSDIHGNAWALSRVLEDIISKKPDMLVNLGDSLYGPLDPGGTFELLQSYEIISISGNEDRILLEDGAQESSGGTKRYVLNQLRKVALDWLRSLQKTHILDCGIFMCHGTPQSDSEYLLEKVIDERIARRDEKELNMLLIGIDQKIVLCSHSHTPGIVEMKDRILINPGSVGLPAYDDDIPVYHKIENFSSHAHYCILEFNDQEIKVEQVSIGYDFESAARCAEKNKRNDWARWIRTGRA